MIKLLAWFIEIIFWIQIFLSPLFLFCIPAFLVYAQHSDLLWVSVTLAVAGFIVGIIFAEKVRRKYGCTAFMGSLLNTSGIPLQEKDKSPNK